MSSNGLMDIIRVTEQEDLDKVNLLLSHGWKLIMAFPHAQHSDAPYDLTSVYSLGAPSDLSESALALAQDTPPRYGWD